MPSHLTVEIKARCDDPEAVLQRLQRLGAVLQGGRSSGGHLLLRVNRASEAAHREHRELLDPLRPRDYVGPKDSRVTLIGTRAEESEALRSLLAGALGIVVEVDKLRHVLWIDNVKFHVDEARGLGAFVEIEAIDRTGEIGRASLLTQGEHYLELLGIADTELEARSQSAGEALTVVDRRTGEWTALDRETLRALAELTVANELDVFAHSPEFLARHGTKTATAFRSWKPLVGARAGADLDAGLTA